MTARAQVYKCAICGNIVEVLHAGKGELVCCGQPMTLQAENTVDASREKHVPVLSAGDGAVRVAVGSVPHPMEAQHYIEWIEVEGDGGVQRRYLEPGQAPNAEFCGSSQAAGARAYCNLHGLWKS